MLPRRVLRADCRPLLPWSSGAGELSPSERLSFRKALGSGRSSEALFVIGGGAPLDPVRQRPRQRSSGPQFTGAALLGRSRRTRDRSTSRSAPRRAREHSMLVKVNLPLTCAGQVIQSPATPASCIGCPIAVCPSSLFFFFFNRGERSSVRGERFEA